MSEPDSTKNRRRHPRVAFDVDANIATSDSFYVARTRDISAGGLFLASDVELPPGTPIIVRLRVEGMHVNAECRVAWSLADEAGKPIGVGVEFERLTPAARRAIDRIIARAAPDVVELEPQPVVSHGPPKMPGMKPPRPSPRVSAPA